MAQITLARAVIVAKASTPCCKKAKVKAATLIHLTKPARRPTAGICANNVHAELWDYSEQEGNGCTALFRRRSGREQSWSFGEGTCLLVGDSFYARVTHQATLS